MGPHPNFACAFWREIGVRPHLIPCLCRESYLLFLMNARTWSDTVLSELPNENTSDM